MKSSPTTPDILDTWHNFFVEVTTMSYNIDSGVDKNLACQLEFFSKPPPVPYNTTFLEKLYFWFPEHSCFEFL